MASVDAVKILENTENMKRLFTKLPPYLDHKWGSFVSKKGDYTTIGFSDLVEFVERQSFIANHPVWGSAQLAEARSTTTRQVANTKQTKQGTKKVYATTKPRKLSYN